MKFSRIAASVLLTVLTVLCNSQSWALNCAPGHLVLREAANNNSVHMTDALVEDIPGTTGTNAITTDGDNVIIYRGDEKIVRIGCTSEQVIELNTLPTGVLGTDPDRRKLFIGSGDVLYAYNLDTLLPLGSITVPNLAISDIDVLSTGCPVVVGSNSVSSVDEVYLCPDPAGDCNTNSTAPEPLAVSSITLKGITVKRSTDDIYVGDVDFGCVRDVVADSCITGPTPLPAAPAGLAASQTDDVVYIGLGDEVAVQNLTSGDWSTFNDQVYGGAAEIAIIGAAVTCGNGIPESPEQCDAGIGGSACCTASCQLVAANTVCDDDNACTVDTVCDGEFGTCGGGDPLNCDDGKPCTEDTCEEVLGCEHALLGANTPCSDGNQCTVGEQCDGSLDGYGCGGGSPLTCEDGDLCTRDPVCNPSLGCVGTHPFEPAPGSVVALSGSIQIQQYAEETKNQLKLKVKGGTIAPSLLGDPLTDTKLALCVRRTGTGNPIPLYSVTLNPGGTCPTNACWKKNKPETQVTYAHKTDPTRKIIVKSDPAGEKSQFQAAIKGLPLPTECPTEVICGDDVEAWIANSAGLNWSIEFNNLPLVDEKKYKNKK